jgi:hypothetical protein
MIEGVAEPRFSRRTVIAAVEVIEYRIKTHADLTRRLLKWSPELAERCNDGALPDRFNHLIKFYDEQPLFFADDGGLLADELVEQAASVYGQTPSPQVDAFQRALDLDGFTLTDGVLGRTLPEPPRVCRRLFRLSHAAMTGCSVMA